MEAKLYIQALILYFTLMAVVPKKFDWKKVLLDVIKVLLGALGGWLAS